MGLRPMQLSSCPSALPFQSKDQSLTGPTLFLKLKDAPERSKRGNLGFSAKTAVWLARRVVVRAVDTQGPGGIRSGPLLATGTHLLTLSQPALAAQLGPGPV